MPVFCYPSLGCKIKMKESLQVVAKDMVPTRLLQAMPAFIRQVLRRLAKTLIL